MNVDCNTLLLAAAIIGPALFIIFSLFYKVKELIATPIVKNRVFEDLENQDGFTKVRKASKEHKFLTETFDTMFSPFIGKRQVSLKRAVFQKDDYDYYICDLALFKTNNSKRNDNPEQHTYYICLFIDVCLNIPETLVIKKKGNSPLNRNHGDSFDDNYTITSASHKNATKLLYPEVQELFEKFSGRYPMSYMDSNAYTAPIGRSAIISNKGIAVSGNPDGSRYNIAEMLDLGKKLLYLMKTITDSEEIN